MIHISKLQQLLERVDGNKRRVPFELTFIKKSTGEKVDVQKAVCTSTFAENRTANIMFYPSMETRTISMLSIVKFNGEEVFV